MTVPEVGAFSFELRATYRRSKVKVWARIVTIPIGLILKWCGLATTLSKLGQVGNTTCQRAWRGGAFFLFWSRGYVCL